MKDKIVLEEEAILNTYGTDYGEDDREPWDNVKYCDKIDVKIINNRQFELEFDLVNLEAPFANALRRLMLAEVPSMAIDRVFLYQNTSLIQDEVFCHRLGMIPIKADPRLFNYRKDLEDEKDVKANNTLEFELHVKCTKNSLAAKENGDEEDMSILSFFFLGDIIIEYLLEAVYSKSLKWLPIGDQATKFALNPPAPVHDDILLNKMRPEQEIELKCHCVKGIGRDHAKFSPVATASYRLLPEIKLKRKIVGEAAERLKQCFSDGVIELIEDKDGLQSAVVKDARRDMCSRNVFRFPDLSDAVQLSRHMRHFIFSVESTGALPSVTLVIEACKVMKNKCSLLIKELKA